MLNLFYVPLVGFPLCVILIATGLFLCCTIILIPAGLATIALGFKVLTLKPRPRVVVQTKSAPPA